MRVSRLLGLLLVVGGCATPGASNGPRPPYSAEEHLTLTKCVALSNLALGIGAVKLRGGSAEELKARYAEGSEQPIPVGVTNQVIDGVFRLEAESPYGYSQAYFASCAQEVAKISDERLAFAQGCMSQANMALAAQFSKDKGAAQEAEVEKLSRYGVPRTREIVERVYAGTQTPADAQTDAWESCMAPFRAP
jgi:hypothetical protein